MNIEAEVALTIHNFQEILSINLKMGSKQIEYCAKCFIEQYPMENISDLEECFKRAASGNYGELWKVDQPTIFIWFKSYLEEKYEEKEFQLTKEKKARLAAERNKDVLPIAPEQLAKLKETAKELDTKSKQHKGTIGAALREKLRTDGK